MIAVLKLIGALALAVFWIYAIFKRQERIHDKPLVRSKIQTLFGDDLKD